MITGEVRVRAQTMATRAMATRTMATLTSRMATLTCSAGGRTSYSGPHTLTYHCYTHRRWLYLLLIRFARGHTPLCGPRYPRTRGYGNSAPRPPPWSVYRQKRPPTRLSSAARRRGPVVGSGRGAAGGLRAGEPRRHGAVGSRRAGRGGVWLLQVTHGGEICVS